MSALHKKPAILLILENSVYDMCTHAYGKFSESCEQVL